jgi:hypothetical protein
MPGKKTFKLIFHRRFYFEFVTKSAIVTLVFVGDKYWKALKVFNKING